MHFGGGGQKFSPMMMLVLVVVAFLLCSICLRPTFVLGSKLPLKVAAEAQLEQDHRRHHGGEDGGQHYRPADYRQQLAHRLEEARQDEAMMVADEDKAGDMLQLPNLLLERLQTVQGSFGIGEMPTTQTPLKRTSIHHHNHHHQQQQQQQPQQQHRNSAEASSVPLTSAYGPRSPSSSAQQSEIELDIDAFVPPGYDKLMPPKENGKPTTVRFHVWVLGLDSIDEGSMTYVADIFMSQSWKDHRLVIPHNITFNVNSSSDPRGPYRLLPLTLIDKIWRPDSFFKNAKEVTFQEMTIPNHYIWLYSDHTILYMVKLSLLLSCAMKFQAYPHDTQNCTLKIESLSYTTNDLVFDWEESRPLEVEKTIELPQHDLVMQQIDYCTTDYSSGTFACVQVLFTIKRRLGYYIFHTYIPTCLIVIMSWISFWIKPEAVPARVTLCVTSLLTLSTQHAQSQKSLPPVSYIKAIDIFMSSCTVFVFASLMEYALVNILMSDEWLNGWNMLPAEGTPPGADYASSSGFEPVAGGGSSSSNAAEHGQTCSVSCSAHHMPTTGNRSVRSSTSGGSNNNKCSAARWRGSHQHNNNNNNNNNNHAQKASDDLYDSSPTIPTFEMNGDDEDEENEDDDEVFAELETICNLRHKKVVAEAARLSDHGSGRNHKAASLTDLNSSTGQCRYSKPSSTHIRRQNSWSIVRLLSRTRGANKHLARASSSASGAHQFVPHKYSQHPTTATLVIDSTSIPTSHQATTTTTNRVVGSTNRNLKQRTTTTGGGGGSVRQKSSSSSQPKQAHKYDLGQNCRPKSNQKRAFLPPQQSYSNWNDNFGAGTIGPPPPPGLAMAGSYQRLHRRAYVVDNVSRWIFPLSFIVLNIFYWAYYLELLDGLKAFYRDRIQFW